MSLICIYDAFKADPVIASVASAATAPAGYYQNFVNLKGASSAYAYLGYSQVKTYDVASCEAKRTKKTGCIAFNIYFERDPVVEPSFNGNCENLAAFANIKCSFWGSILEDKTANNYGQWRPGFQVGIAGSNAYTSYSVGGPVDGTANSPLSLGTSVMNASLRDCVGTWTYMGYKLYTDSSYDPRLCKAACDAQTAYNAKHAPTDGTNPATCSAFDSYLLTKTNSTGSYLQGQMCTLYTSAWDAKYAVNTVSYNDAIGAKYTYSLSYFHSIPTLQPVCPGPYDCSKPYTCGSEIQFCPFSTFMYCAKTTSGKGMWTSSEACGARCTTDADWGSSNQFCAIGGCCGYPNCHPKAMCSNNSAASRLFRPRARQDNKKRADTGCVPSDLVACPVTE